MAVSERENILKCYRHEMPDHLPDFTAMHIMAHVNGFLERPPNNRGGKDWFGVEWIYEETGNAPLPDPSAIPIVSDISNWREQVKFPDLDAWDWELAVKLDKPDEIDKEKFVLASWVMNGIFERFQTLLGLEESMVALLTDTDEAFEFISAITDHKLKLYEKLIAYYKPDIICQHDDYGSQTSMLLSPELWRKLIKPNTARLADFCKQHGVFFEQHSCGLVEPIVPDLCEIGVTSWQGMHINDIPKLKQQTNGKLNYFTTMDMQKYAQLDSMGKLTEDLIRSDVRKTITESAKGGSYIPFVFSVDESWWGVNVIIDEFARCREFIKY